MVDQAFARCLDGSNRQCRLFCVSPMPCSSVLLPLDRYAHVLVGKSGTPRLARRFILFRTITLFARSHSARKRNPSTY